MKILKGGIAAVVLVTFSFGFAAERNAIEDSFKKAEILMGYKHEIVPDYERARAEYTKILNTAAASSQDKAQAFFRRGDTFAAERRYEEAILEYAKAAEIKEAGPHFRAEALYNIGSNHIALGDFQKARSAYGKILEMDGLSKDYRELVEQRIRTIYR